ncbi:hypothetical protein [Magnetospira sp. QH-2]|uniref:hypothetical protein n=1 Tax=Magnetospira sp. (strain QH-2) TaxID=1288970 RepID=UPI0003E80A72|nr:hypothetical protein [Magnetospira sp. QH-2]CCQ74911.1 conserved protein of unknown function [Magnetospira sp. QH-2]
MALVVQSFRRTTVPGWIEACLGSVRTWAKAEGHQYRFVGDEIFDLLPQDYRAKTINRPQVGTDLGRLLLARQGLADGAEAVLWLDADILITEGPGFDPWLDDLYGFGAELWVQPDKQGRPVARRNVHNAVCLFRPDNPFLDFYIHACQRLVGRHKGDMVPQFVGPKFLTGLDHMLGFPLIHDVAMASPMVLRDLADGEGPALDLLIAGQEKPAAAVNLCASLAGREVDGVDISVAMFERAVARLLGRPELLHG